MKRRGATGNRENSIVHRSLDEGLYGAKANFIHACEKYGVKYSVRERSGMIHAFAMLLYFRELKQDFRELAAYLAE